MRFATLFISYFGSLTWTLRKEEQQQRLDRMFCASMSQAATRDEGPTLRGKFSDAIYSPY
eukprot:1191804-Prorocentrum_minimum.AAC.3